MNEPEHTHEHDHSKTDLGLLAHPHAQILQAVDIESTQPKNTLEFVRDLRRHLQTQIVSGITGKQLLRVQQSFSKLGAEHPVPGFLSAEEGGDRYVISIVVLPDGSILRDWRSYQVPNGTEMKPVDLFIGAIESAQHIVGRYALDDAGEDHTLSIGSEFGGHDLSFNALSSSLLEILIANHVNKLPEILAKLQSLNQDSPLSRLLHAGHTKSIQWKTLSDTGAELGGGAKPLEMSLADERLKGASWYPFVGITGTKLSKSALLPDQAVNRQLLQQAVEPAYFPAVFTHLDPIKEAHGKIVTLSQKTGISPLKLFDTVVKAIDGGLNAEELVHGTDRIKLQPTTISFPTRPKS